MGLRDRLWGAGATTEPGGPTADLSRPSAAGHHDRLWGDANPNLVGGDSVSGSHHLWQNFLFRPWPGASTYKMPVDGLWLVGAATWPGSGTNGISGSLCAQRMLTPLPYRNAAVGAAALTVGATAAALAARRRELRA